MTVEKKLLLCACAAEGIATFDPSQPSGAPAVLVSTDFLVRDDGGLECPVCGETPIIADFEDYGMQPPR